jgi:hypothetical protein
LWFEVIGLAFPLLCRAALSRTPRRMTVTFAKLPALPWPTIKAASQ